MFNHAIFAALKKKRKFALRLPEAVRIKRRSARRRPAVAASGGVYRWSGATRVVAVSDIHGAYDELCAILAQVGLIDCQRRWIGADTHLVTAGDLIDRGPRSRDVLELLMRLQDEAARAGGAVHVLLGNHEVMNLTGDLRFVSETDFLSVSEQKLNKFIEADINSTYRSAFSAYGQYGAWLMQQPFAVQIDETLFIHGGLTEPLESMDLTAINVHLRHELHTYMASAEVLLRAGIFPAEADPDARFRMAREAATRRNLTGRLRRSAAKFAELEHALLFAPDGPLWSRATAQSDLSRERRTVMRVLSGLGARRVAIGHTPTETRRITARMGGRVLLLDTGASLQGGDGRASALVIENGKASCWYTDRDGGCSPARDDSGGGETLAETTRPAFARRSRRPRAARSTKRNSENAEKPGRGLTQRAAARLYPG